MKRDEREAWGPIIAKQRKHLGLTQKQLAKKAGVGLGTVGNMEGGKHAPQEDNLRRVLDALDLSIDIRVSRRLVDEAYAEESATEQTPEEKALATALGPEAWRDLIRTIAEVSQAFEEGRPLEASLPPMGTAAAEAFVAFARAMGLPIDINANLPRGTQPRGRIVLVAPDDNPRDRDDFELAADEQQHTIEAEQEGDEFP